MQHIKFMKYLLNTNYSSCFCLLFKLMLHWC